MNRASAGGDVGRMRFSWNDSTPSEECAVLPAKEQLEILRRGVVEMIDE